MPRRTHRIPVCWAVAIGVLLWIAAGVRAQEPVLTVNGNRYERCGTAFPAVIPLGDPSDCSLSFTNPSGIYAPGGVLYQIPVVVHVIQSSSGEGFISESRVQSQIDVLNEDFRALAGTPGGGGTDTGIEFFLATEDPQGNPTSGITYTTNDLWFNDFGNYWDTLAWDPNRYLNIYTHSAGGFLGYVSFFPQEGAAGSQNDRVVILHEAFGVNPAFDPYDLGRTATHEVGHYLGLFHVFQDGCGSSSQCASTGDRICDTNPQSSPVYGCPSSSSSCGSADNFRNYMDYSDDVCFTEFTQDQARRMRCTLENYRCALVSACGPMMIPDFCADAISVSNGTTSFDTTGATTDGPVEPSACGSGAQPENDVWFRYSATCTAEITVSLCGSGFDTRVAIYEGSCPTTSAAIACDDDSCGTRSETAFPAIAGSDYLIRVGGADGATGPVQMVITCPDDNADPGAECATATDVFEGTTSFDTTGATTDGPDEPSVCEFFGYTQVDNDVWFRYQPVCTGLAVASLCGSAFDSKIAIYSGSCPTGPSAIACNDDECSVQSEVSFPVVAGATYFIRVGGFEGDTGPGELTLSCQPGGGPAADFCQNAQMVADGVTSFDTTGATTDGPAEAAQCNFYNYIQVGNDVWYRYEASCTGDITVGLCGSFFDTKLAIYAGDCPTGPSAIACSDDSCGFQSEVTFAGIAGETYYIRIGGFLGDTGSGELSISCAGTPQGDYTDLVWAHPDQSGGLTGDESATVAALVSAGVEVSQILVVDDVLQAGDLCNYDRVWTLLGTYPDNHVMTVAEGKRLANYATACGGNLYVQGADHFFFDPVDQGAVTPLHDLYGITPLQDGGPDVSDLRGLDSNTGLDASGFPSVLFTGENEFMDHIEPDPAFAGAGLIWIDDLTAAPVGVFHDGKSSGLGDFRIILSVFELGGVPSSSQRSAITELYLEAFGGSSSGIPFLRGDCDGDLTVSGLADTLFALNFGFIAGAPEPPCRAQCDANGNGTLNPLADALYVLTFSFAGGPPPPPPFPDCGVEPGSATVLALGCDTPVCP